MKLNEPMSASRASRPMSDRIAVSRAHEDCSIAKTWRTAVARTVAGEIQRVARDRSANRADAVLHNQIEYLVFSRTSMRRSP